MADPAFDAAKRVIDHWTTGGWNASRDFVAEASAREALKPVRAVLDQLAEDTFPPCDFAKRYELYEKAISALSPLVYTTDELANG